MASIATWRGVVSGRWRFDGRDSLDAIAVGLMRFTYNTITSSIPIIITRKDSTLTRRLRRSSLRKLCFSSLTGKVIQPTGSTRQGRCFIYSMPKWQNIS